jgi:hypothetical protein
MQIDSQMKWKLKAHVSICPAFIAGIKGGAGLGLVFTKSMILGLALVFEGGGLYRGGKGCN